MARRVFFSFHYENDVWRAGQIRNSWVARDREAAGFWDAADWESVKRGGDEAVHRWIKKQLENTSVTVVLIGAQTSERQYVLYEIEHSHNRGNGLLGIYIHNMKNQQGQTSIAGSNPFDKFTVTQNGRKIPLSTLYPTYDWVLNRGYDNIAQWIEAAAKAAGH